VRPSQLPTIVGAELSRVLRSPRGLLFGVFFLGSFVPIAFSVRRLAAELGDISVPLDDRRLELVYEPISWFTELDRGVIADLVRDHPPALLVLFAAAIWITPLLTMLATFDQTASDIRIRHLRFLLTRTDRTTLYVGKVMGAWILMAVALALAIGLAGLLLATTPAGLGGVAGAAYLVRIWLSLTLFALPFVGLMAFTGALTGHPYLALGLGIGAQFLIWVIASGGGAWIDALEHAQNLFPTAWKYFLMSDQPRDLSLAVGHQLGLAAVFLAAGWFRFGRRDV
jgi:ABC-type transport system involved in multi-copper enzyme maturation permease subunit